MMHPPPSLAAVLTLEDCSNGHMSPASTRLLSSPILIDSELLGSSTPTQECPNTALVKPLSYHHLAPSIMREEVNAAVEFFLKMVETPQLSPAMPRLGRNLSKVLSNKYKDHWFINTPQRGQAYRCIEVCDTQGEDRVLAEAAAASGLRYSELRLPADLCVWVDPKEVACRFGDELGSFLPIYINENGKKRNFVDKFNFERLCERTTPNGPLIVGRGGRMTDRGVLRRVGSGGVERVEVEVERGVSVAPSPSTSVSLLICGGGDSALLTPPSTPPHSPDHSSSPRSPSASPVLFTPPHTDSFMSPTKQRYSPTQHNLHHLNNNIINNGYHRSKPYQQHGNINLYNSNSLHSRSPPQHQFHHHQHHNHHQQMSVSPTHHYHHKNMNNNNNTTTNNNNNNNTGHYHSSTTSNYNIYNNSNGSNLNSNAAYYGNTNGSGFSRSPPRFNGFSGGKPPGKWGPHHGTVFPSSVASNNNIHHHQQYFLQQKREVDSPRWLWQGRRAKV